ncbi:hypothetical protein Z948_2222 [Sulfitobacter donghicola DSW-25 = KCTC 12864 = JCM 14565]|nr:hypothetical protein Z948_2222 [Sulfitobacter donghicola DSW-25 = KCTC 12864 = JCM 14565]
MRAQEPKPEKSSAIPAEDANTLKIGKYHKTNTYAAKHS